ncbi:MAG: hypothetical protein ACYCSF_05285 [Acidimicrobiales bacterium]
MGPPHDQDEAGASIVPIEVLTREATFRRFAELAQRTDAPPASLHQAVLAAGRGARASGSAWRSIDDELAVLVYDSDHDPDRLENVRAHRCTTRRMTFQAPELLLEVEITLSRPRSLVCQVVPPQPAAVEVRQGNGVVASETDPFGTFQLNAVAPGPVSLWCRPGAEGAASVATSWVRI